MGRLADSGPAEDAPGDAGNPQNGESYFDVAGISTFDT